MVSLSADSWNFGTLKRGEKNTGEITVANQGSDTLSIALHLTCDCLEAWMDTARLAPGESLPIHLAYRGDDIKDRITKTLYVDSNDPASPRIAVEVTGQVIPGDGPHLAVMTDPLLFDPEDPLYPEASLQLRNVGGQHLEIIDVRCFGCEIDHWEPVSLAGRGRVAGESALGDAVYTIKVRKIESWTGTRWIEIESDDPVTPVRKVAILEL